VSKFYVDNIVALGGHLSNYIKPRSSFFSDYVHGAGESCSFVVGWGGKVGIRARKLIWIWSSLLLTPPETLNNSVCSGLFRKLLD